MIPGLMLAGIYVVYLLGLGFVRPEMVPAVPQEERDQLSKTELAGKLLQVVLPPIALVGAVLGSIIAGVAARPRRVHGSARRDRGDRDRRAHVVGGAAGHDLRDNAHHGDDDVHPDVRAGVLARVPRTAGEKLVQDFLRLPAGGTSGAIWFLMFIIFILGFFIEWIEISYIAVPLFLPIFVAANVDMVWLATLICVNLQTSFLTPPFGWALFFLRGVAPPEVTTGDIYRGIVPFVVMQLIAWCCASFSPVSRCGCRRRSAGEASDDRPRRG